MPIKNCCNLLILCVLIGCSSANINSNLKQNNKNLITDYALTITAKDLGNHLFTYASDNFEGRETGEIGQKNASRYLKNFYTKNDIQSPLENGEYFQKIKASYLNYVGRSNGIKASENVIAYIKGKEKPDEVIVISAHLDHLGKNRNGEIYNGADDDGSGTVALLEIAEAFKKATLEGNRPKRSILFLHLTGEEKGLIGSRYYTEIPVFPLKKTVVNLNIDMIGRTDAKHKGNPNYIYLIGSNKISKELHQISEEVNKKYTQLKLDYTYNKNDDPNRFFYRSDHYNFAKNNIPIIFYFNGTHQDYHKPSDTPDKINYEILEKRTRLIFYTAWTIANKEERISVDKVFMR